MITDVKIDICKVSLNDGRITCDVELDNSEGFIEYLLECYFSDGEQDYLFHSVIITEETDLLTITGDINSDEILAIVKKSGLQTYRLKFKIEMSSREENLEREYWVQFSDVVPSINASNITINDTEKSLSLTLSAEYFNNESMSISCIIGDNEITSYFNDLSYNETDEKWYETLTIDYSSLPNGEYLISLAGEYNGNPLPCNEWSYYQTFEEKIIINGGIMVLTLTQSGSGTATANGSDIITLTATLTDNGTRVSGVDIAFMCGGSARFSNGENQYTQSTDANGVSTATLTNTVAQTVLITAVSMDDFTSSVMQVTFAEAAIDNNTHFPTGLNIFYDGPYNDRACSVARTALSNHFVGSFRANRTSTYTTVYLRAYTAAGVLLTEKLIPTDTTNNQYDVDITAIDGTDDIVAVWVSNASGSRRVYCRRFTVTDSAIESATDVIMLSGSSENYVAPRVIYNAALDQVFVCWAAVASKEIQMLFIDKSSLEAVSRQQVLDASLYTGYFSATLDIHGQTGTTNSVVSIALINSGDQIFAAFKKATNAVEIYSLSSGTSGSITQSLYDSISVTSIGYFHMEHNPTDNKIMFVYNNPGTGYVYGMALTIFSRAAPAVEERAYESVRLNNETHVSLRPYIRRYFSSDDSINNYIIAWETGPNPLYFNSYNGNFLALGSETVVNTGDQNTDNAAIVTTENQAVIMMHATKKEGDSLTGYGVLTYGLNL
jgi:hypothetical protein